jgi:TonB family protein
MHTLENNRAATAQRALQNISERKQARLMRVALGLLCLAFVVVAAKNWQFWSEYLFPEDQMVQSEPVQPATSDTVVRSQPQAAQPQAPPHTSSRAKSREHIKAASAPVNPKIAPVVTASNRTILPPLEIEVVAGNQHQNVQSNKRSINVEMPPDQTTAANQQTPSAPVSGDDGVTANASDRTVISRSTADVVSHQVEPNYPMLAKQMKVQGAVIMQALIGRSGNIQDLRVLSGPAILSAAAREAVKQWHFKPYLLAGQAVETEARITVNFTISTD